MYGSWNAAADRHRRGWVAALRTLAPARVARIGPMPCGHGATGHTGTAGVGRADEHTPTHPLAAVSRVR